MAFALAGSAVTLTQALGRVTAAPTEALSLPDSSPPATTTEQPAAQREAAFRVHFTPDKGRHVIATEGPSILVVRF